LEDAVAQDQEKVKEYDGIIIGSGQGAKPLALALAAAGWATALVERQYVGGTCINYGCTPTKTMVASARVAYLTRRGNDYGVRTRNIEIDLLKVRERKRAIVQSFREGSERRIRGTQKLDFIQGEATFVDSNRLEIKLDSGQIARIKGKKIFINTGCRPSIPPIPGLNEVPWLDSTSIMELGQTPEHLLVLGGGYIGLEFGQMFRRFGSRVSIVQRGRQLLSREDTDVAEEVASILREDGVEILLATEVVRVKKNAENNLELIVKTPDGERVLSGSHLLLASGRVPNIEALKLARAGVATDSKGFIKANERLETSVPHIYALGDVKGGPAFTHISYDDFRILKTNLIDGGRASIQGRLVPYTVFIDPQLGRVGLTETEARQRGLTIRIAKMPMAYVARALEVDESRGFMKAIVESSSGKILGCAVLGIEGGEIMSQLQIAMMGNLSYTDLRDAVFAHPTLAESLNNLFSNLT
jgi:pyruvate/2-oxoglutarate dehydrogenase complex dihydrolipoamide dehydrogenase (E3) component